MVIRKADDDVGSIQRVGQVLCDVPAEPDARDRLCEVQEVAEATKEAAKEDESSAAYADGVRDKSREEANRAPPASRRRGGKGKRGQSLQAHHEKLANEGYVAPPPKEFPFEYRGRKPIRRKLTDDDVIEARKLAVTTSCARLATMYGVGYMSMYSAIKGWSFKHLNLDHPPQF